MADNPDLRSIGNLNSLQRRWRDRCANFERFVKDWESPHVNHKWWRDSNHVPRCFSQIRREVRNRVYTGQVDEIEDVRNLASCPMTQFADSLELLLEAEEVYQAIETRKHDIPSQRLVPIWDDNNVLIKIGFEMPNLADRLPPIATKDYIVLKNLEGFQLMMHIDDAWNGFIALPKRAYERYEDRLQEPVRVSFLPLNDEKGMQQLAIQKLRDSRTMQEIVFEEVGIPRFSEVKIDVTQTSTEELDERLQALNGGRRDAVIGMLEARCRPKPYIFYAPSGGGKTDTQVEAVVQVYKRWYSSVAQANRSCAKAGSANKIPPRPRNVDLKILVSNSSLFSTKRLHRKIKEQLPNARMLLLTSGQYLDKSDQSEIVCASHAKSRSLFGVHTFDYIFLDEANEASIAESLVLASLLKPDGCLVLSGDPFKLAPEVGCRQAGELGLGLSLMERLLEFGIYQRDQQTGGYDKRLITMLRECDFSDARIMDTCNRLFYDNELIVSEGTPRGLLAVLRWSGPVQFRHVAGEEKADLQQDSMFNQAEISVCVDLLKRLYCMGIMPDRIGITSPYRLQVDMIGRALESLNAEIKPILCDRFYQYKLRPIRRMSNEGVEPSRASIGQYVQARGSRLYKQISEGSFVECDLETLPEDLSALYVRQDSVAKKLDCQMAMNGALRADKKAIMIISTVRSQGEGDSLRDLCDPRRFNVNISRAKWLVIVVGNRDVLERAEYWRELLANAETDLDAWPANVDCTDPFSQRPLFHVR